jgi:predicted NUDIX family NTP pyrophosphohydrolase
MACALREAHEEFGLVFDPERLEDLGRHPYYPGKDLHLYAVRTTSAETDIEQCRCLNVFEHPKTGQSMPEVDGFAWSDDAELSTRLAKSMKRLLLDKGLLATARSRHTLERLVQEIASDLAGRYPVSSVTFSAKLLTFWDEPIDTDV